MRFSANAKELTRLVTKSHRYTLLLLLAGTLAVILGVQAYLGISRQSQSRPDIPGLLWPNPKPIAPFSLTDQRGQPFDLDRLKGHWTFLFFGYTHCPDVCPMTLSVLASVAKQFSRSPAEAENVQFAFVTVDPARDTREHMAAYLPYFNKDFLGVSGPDDKLAGLTRQLGIVYLRSEPEADGSYLVDHTASILLVGPEGHLIALFSAPHDPLEIAERFGRIRQFVES